MLISDHQNNGRKISIFFPFPTTNKLAGNLLGISDQRFIKVVGTFGKDIKFIFFKKNFRPFFGGRKTTNFQL